MGCTGFAPGYPCVFADVQLGEAVGRGTGRHLWVSACFVALCLFDLPASSAAFFVAPSTFGRRFAYRVLKVKPWDLSKRQNAANLRLVAAFGRSSLGTRDGSWNAVSPYNSSKARICTAFVC